MVRLPSEAGIKRQFLPVPLNYCYRQVGEAAQRSGDCPAQLVAPQVQFRQVGEAAQRSGDWLNWLLPQRQVRLVRLPSEAGIVPLNWLLPRDRSVRLVRLPSEAGISPLNWLLRRDRSVEIAQRAGISPLNWLLHRDRSVRLVRLPSDRPAQLVVAQGQFSQVSECPARSGSSRSTGCSTETGSSGW